MSPQANRTKNAKRCLPKRLPQSPEIAKLQLLVSSCYLSFVDTTSIFKKAWDYVKNAFSFTKKKKHLSLKKSAIHT
jgi:hypothetical protein